MMQKSFISNLFVIPISIGVILFATFLWTPNYLITPPQLSGFEQQIEIAIPVLLIPLYSFIIPNKYEIELGLVNGYSTFKLVLTKVTPIFIFSTITSFIAIAVYRYIPYDLVEFKPFIPIFVPENFKIYMVISISVTILFFSSVFLFMRVLTRNCFLPIIVDLLFFSALSSISESIRKGYADLRISIVDPFITTYFVGNTLPNAYANKNPELSLMMNAWTVNRLIFLILSLTFFAATVFLLRRERLHRGPGE